MTKLKRESKITYYNNFFEINKNKSSIIWKGIRSLVNIRSSSKKIISLIDENGSKIIIPQSISTHFNKYFASVGANIEKKIPKTNKNFRDYLGDIHIDKAFFLTACSSNEIWNYSYFWYQKISGSLEHPYLYFKAFQWYFFFEFMKDF